MRPKEEEIRSVLKVHLLRLDLRPLVAKIADPDERQIQKNKAAQELADALYDAAKRANDRLRAGDC